ncbi:NAD(P)/FAD-dependent oxidoreductase [Rhodococcus koreensis]
MSAPSVETTSDRPCVVVGASLAGLRACEGLRKGGYDGRIVVFGQEMHPPYNRPPLSKTALAQDEPIDPEFFRLGRALDDVEWRLGEPVASADLTARTVSTEGGATQDWSGLIIATGLRPRRLDLPGPQLGRYVVRTVEDTAALRTHITAGAPVVVVGAGFIGCEIAATLSALGAQVHLVDPSAAPMERPLGPMLGQIVHTRLEAAAITFHLGTAPTEYLGGTAVEGVRLDNGTEIPALAVVEAVGGAPNVEWLAGNGLDLSDGVLCGPELHVADRSDVLACGDVARFPHVLHRGLARRIEHWFMAGDTGRQAGRNLASYLTGGRIDDAPFAPMPSFWSDLGLIRLQSFGLPGQGMGDVRLLEGDQDNDLAAGYFHDGELVGVVLIGLGTRYQHYRGEIARVLSTARADAL